MRFGHFVVGPAGSGKSRLCCKLVQHAQTLGRTIHVINLDPGAETFDVAPSFDIREFITVADVMEECQLGPNGSLIYCMEWLLNHITYLTDELDGYADNSYFLFDCPGQIELYVHLPIVPRIVQLLDQRFVRSATVFLLDSQCVNDIPKYVSGALSAMTTMLNMGLPQLNILSKLDLFQQPLSRLQLQRFLDGDVTTVMQAANHAMPAKFRRLNERIAPTLDDYGLLGFLPLNYLDIDTLERVLYQMDAIVQHGDELEPAGKDLREERDESQELFEAMQGNKDDMIRELLERRPNDPTA